MCCYDGEVDGVLFCGFVVFEVCIEIVGMLCVLGVIGGDVKYGFEEDDLIEVVYVKGCCVGEGWL